MFLSADVSTTSTGVAVLALGAVGLYIASRAAADALAGGWGGDVSGRLALGHWIPIAAVAWLAAAGRDVDLALGVIFGSSVAALTLTAGLITYLGPPEALPPSRRAWPFVLPAALLIMVAGFSSHLTMVHGIMMLILGMAVLSVWRSGPPREPTLEDVLAPDAAPADRPTLGGNAFRAAQWILAAALAVLGAKLALNGTLRMEGTFRVLRGNLMPAALLGPLLVLPTLASGSTLAHRGRSGEACGALVGIVLLNLCLLLPVVIVLWYLRGAGASLHLPLHLAGPIDPVPLPLPIWRIDTVVLVVLGFAITPVAAGRWAVGRLESAGLVMTYAAYLAATAAVAQRM